MRCMGRYFSVTCSAYDIDFWIYADKIWVEEDPSSVYGVKICFRFAHDDKPDESVSHIFKKEKEENVYSIDLDIFRIWDVNIQFKGRQGYYEDL